MGDGAAREKQQEKLTAEEENIAVAQAGKETGAEFVRASLSKVGIPKSLANTGQQIIDNIEEERKLEQIKTQTPEQAIAALHNATQDNTEFDDPKQESIVNTFADAIKSGNLVQAISTLFNFMKGVLGSSSSDISSTVWFKESKEIQDFLSWLVQNKDSMTIDQLEETKKKLTEKIDSVAGVKRKIGLTYALSRLLDEIVYKKDPKKSRMKGHSDGPIGEHINKQTIARMAQQVQPGDVLAVNKSEKKVADKLLTELVEGDYDTSHVLIVTGVDKEKGTITVAHSTGSKLNGGGSGVETEISFTEYANQFQGLAIAALRPPIANAETLVNNVRAKNGKEYDKRSAIAAGIDPLKEITSDIPLLGNYINNLENNTRNNDKYNCVELIAQSFGDDIPSERKKRTHPAQMLQSMKPVYVTIAGTAAGGS